MTMAFLALTSLLVLLVVSSLTTAKSCVNFTIPATINTRQPTFNIPVLTTNELVAEWSNNFTSTATPNYTNSVLMGYHNVHLTANISATFCTPDTGMGRKPIVQVLTHGIGFDKSYWDLPFNNFSHSYTSIAVDEHGYCTLSYDRLGISNSYSADLSPIQTIQAPAQVAVLVQLNNMLRTGTLPISSITHHHAFNQSNSIVNVGHSFGAQQTYQLAREYPHLTDAIVLTGFAFNESAAKSTVASFNSQLARLNQPLRFGRSSITKGDVAAWNQFLGSFGLDQHDVADLFETTGLLDLLSDLPAVGQNLRDGWLTWASAWSNQYNFLYHPTTPAGMLQYLESTKHPFTPTELLSLGLPPPTPITFLGPVLILTGRQDSIYCSADCLATGDPKLKSIPAAAEVFFPKSRAFRACVLEGVGHAVNAHESAVEAFEEIQAFLEREGVVPT